MTAPASDPLSTIVVTGAGGYIGAHVVKALLELGHEVVAVVRGASRTAFDSHPRLRVTETDVLADDADIQALVSDASAVIHLAWHDGFVLASPAHLENLSGHARFVSRLREAGVPRVALAGTMHEIGYWEGGVTAETPTDPSNQYGIAKDALRRAVFAPPATEGTEIVWFRMFYIYGDDTRSNSVFGKILAAAERGDATFPFTTGVNEYDFIHIDDLARQIVTVATTEGLTGVVNCSAGRSQSLASRAEAFIRENGLDIRLGYGAFPDRPSDSPRIWGEAPPALSLTRAARGLEE